MCEEHIFPYISLFCIFNLNDMTLLVIKRELIKSTTTRKNGGSNRPSANIRGMNRRSLKPTRLVSQIGKWSFMLKKKKNKKGSFRVGDGVISFPSSFGLSRNKPVFCLKNSQPSLYKNQQFGFRSLLFPLPQARSILT